MRSARADGNQAWRGAEWRDQLRDAVIAGRRMRYLDVGDGPVLLLVHGLGASWNVWYRAIPDLVQDYRVIAVDLPGFGRSEPLERAVNVGSYAEALLGLLDHVDVDRVLVVGHSLGGLITQRLATLDPVRVVGLVLVSTSDGRLEPHQEIAFRAAVAVARALRVLAPPQFVLRPAITMLVAVGPVRRRLLARVVHDPGSIPHELAAHMLMAVYRSPALGHAVRAALSHVDRLDPRAVDTPTLIISGERDRILPSASTHRLAQDIPNATHEVWDNVGHHPMLERPERFNSRLRAAAREMLG
ncbi:alpha/beta fold hydrolase [Actinomycetospora sp. C-140]